MLTMYGEDEFVFAALRAGARGYLLKGAQQDDVVRTVHAAARGDAVSMAAAAADSSTSALPRLSVVAEG